MIKLIDLIENDTTPGEKKKMQNFLYRGSRDQVDLYPNRFTVVGSQKGVAGEGKGMIDTSNHPEDHNNSNAFNKGYPWSFDDGTGYNLEEDGNPIQQALIGREFQTLDDLAKMVSRLKQAGNAQSDIEEFILNYII
jgi:hypothetical protein